MAFNWDSYFEDNGRVQFSAPESVYNSKVKPFRDQAGIWMIWMGERDNGLWEVHFDEDTVFTQEDFAAVSKYSKPWLKTAPAPTSVSAPDPASAQVSEPILARVSSSPAALPAPPVIAAEPDHQHTRSGLKWKDLPLSFKKEQYADPTHGYYEDGVITYYTKPEKRGWRGIIPGRNDDFVDAFEKLEDELGIEVNRVYDPDDADIICNWSDDLIRGKWAGIHQHRYRHEKGHGYEAYSKITVIEDKWYSQSTVIHEIGHALGLSHPEDHRRTDTIMSYGAPGDLPWFTELDIKNLAELYNLGLS